MYGEVDIASCDLFAAVINALVERVDARATRRRPCLDLSGVEFIDVAGTRALVAAASGRSPGGELIVYHPPATLARIIEIGWGAVPGLRLDQSRSDGKGRRADGGAPPRLLQRHHVTSIPRAERASTRLQAAALIGAMSKELAP